MEVSVRNMAAVLLLFLLAVLNAAAASPQNTEGEKTIAIDSVQIQEFKNPLLTSFYKTNGNKTVWIGKKPTRQFLLATLNHCAEEGLNPKTLALGQLNGFENKIDSLADSALINYDLLLTLKLQQYVSQMANGSVNPRSLYRDWDLKQNKIDINSELLVLEKGDSIATEIERLEPNHPIYKSLKKALATLDSSAQDTIGCIAIPRIIYKSESDPSLLPIKRKLIYWNDLKPSDSLTPLFDEETSAALRKFQLRHGLRVDGAIGKATIDALNFSLKQRREQIIVNLERWKWFPRNLGRHYLIVNIPEYNLKVVKDNDTVDTRRVVVGQIARRSVVLSSTFNQIILNPTWTVPPTILEEDLLPAATKKNTYFTTRNIMIYNSKGGVVSPANWQPDKYKHYRYVQSPGDDNSLGNVKFNFPNHYSVYLHDTNHRDLFVKTYRALSSGCIRVENPLPLAQYMLGDKRWTMEKICEVIASGKTTGIPLKEKINIHQLYWTAWMDADGVLQFRQDIYNLDAELYEKLGY